MKIPSLITPFLSLIPALVTFIHSSKVIPFRVAILIKITIMSPISSLTSVPLQIESDSYPTS